MKPEEQRIAIAEACGWTEITFTGTSYQGIRPQSAKRYCNWNRPAPSPNVDDTREWHWLPDYTNSLDAMNEAVETLRYTPEWFDFQRLLMIECGPWMNCIQASAAQRAEAFLKTLSLWKNDN